MNEEKIIEVPKKRGNKSIIIILLGLLLIGTGLFLFFGTDLFKKEKEKEKEKETVTEKGNADKFEGIYASENDKIYIRKQSANEFHYMISGSFEGTAKVTDETAKEIPMFDDNRYFEFKLVDGGIEISYHSDDQNVEVAIDTGKYTKVADYSKDNVYKEAIGDPELLNSKYSGLFKKDGIELYLIQTSEKNVMVESSSKSETDLSDNFEITEENKMGAKDFFDKNVNAYEIIVGDKTITLTVNEDVFGFDEEKKVLAGTYTFEKEITKDEVLNNFYVRY